MFKPKNNNMQPHNHIITKATVQTRATAMGYACRFFCTCSRETDVIDSSNSNKNTESSKVVDNIK